MYFLVDLPGVSLGSPDLCFVMHCRSVSDALLRTFMVRPSRYLCPWPLIDLTCHFIGVLLWQLKLLHSSIANQVPPPLVFFWSP